MSEIENNSSEPRWWKSYWIILIIATIILGITMPFFTSLPFETSVLYMILALFSLGVAYLVRVKQSINLNRIMYLLLGFVIGGVIWMVSLPLFVRLTARAQGYDELFFVVVSLIVCFGGGCVIGDLIGRARNYKGPGRYQP